MLRALGATRRGALGSSLLARRLGSVCRHLRSATTAAAEAEAAVVEEVIVGPSWDLSAAYSALGSPEFEADVESVRGLIAQLATACAALDVEQPDATPPETLAEITRTVQQAGELLGNLSTFANCELTVDGTSPEARASIATARQLSSELSQATASHSMLLQLCSDDVAEAYTALVPEAAFGLRWERRLRDQTLSLSEETLITALSVDGHTAWATLYDNISSSLKCEVEGQGTLGVAQASALLSHPDAATRRAAWNAIQTAWRGAEEAAAGVLNAISGWRLSVNQRRGERAGVPVHYLEPALHSNRMSQASLDAMMQAVTDAAPVGQRALKLQAQALGVEVLHASDLFAPAPEVAGATASAGMPYEEAIELIATAVSRVDPSMGEIVRMMAEEGWIEGTSAETKAPGAYCTSFPVQRQPRVYMSSYVGSYTNVSTLAHELGHAYHNWVMRDMPLAETR